MKKKYIILIITLSIWIVTSCGPNPPVKCDSCCPDPTESTVTVTCEFPEELLVSIKESGADIKGSCKTSVLKGTDKFIYVYKTRIEREMMRPSKLDLVKDPMASGVLLNPSGGGTLLECQLPPGGGGEGDRVAAITSETIQDSIVYTFYPVENDTARIIVSRFCNDDAAITNLYTHYKEIYVQSITDKYGVDALPIRMKNENSINGKRTFTLVHGNKTELLTTIVEVNDECILRFSYNGKGTSKLFEEETSFEKHVFFSIDLAL